MYFFIEESLIYSKVRTAQIIFTFIGSQVNTTEVKLRKISSAPADSLGPSQEDPLTRW